MSDVVVHNSPPTREARYGWLALVAGWLIRHEGFLAVLVFAACFLAPVLRSPIIGHDVEGSLVCGTLQLRGCRLWDLAREGLNDQLAQGRVVPIASLLDPYIACYSGGAVVQKGFVLALILCNVTLFYWLLRRWNVNGSVAQLGVVCLTILFQMRVTEDPILACHGWMQWLVNQLLLSLLCLEAYFRTQRRGWLVASALVYGASLLTDEASYCFALVLLVVAFARLGQWRKALWQMRLHLGVTAIVLAAATGLRLCFALADGVAYQMHWSFPKIAKTACLQAGSALPLSYASFCDSHRAALWQSADRLINWQSCLTLVGAFGLTLFLLRRIKEERSASENKTATWRLPPEVPAVGLVLWIAPALFLAVWPLYQDAAHGGLGFRPVYVQYFGVALLVVSGLHGFAGALKKHWRRRAGCLSLASAAVAALTFASNQSAIERWGINVDYDMRLTLEAAFSAGLGDDVPAESTTMVTTWRSWLDLNRPEISTAFFSHCLRRKVDVINATPGTLPPTFQSDLAKRPGPFYAICEHCPNDRSGWVILSQVDDLGEAFGQSGPLEHTPLRTRRFRVFVRDRVLSPIFYVLPNLIVGHVPSRAYGERDKRCQTIDVAGLRVVNRGRGWALYEGAFDEAADVGALGMAGYPVLTSIHHSRGTDTR
jgi:hypothetical protein